MCWFDPTINKEPTNFFETFETDKKTNQSLLLVIFDSSEYLK